ncbi:MAG: hypothetical protein D6714_13875, partial [Bacteroidetes bacterium]
MLFLPPDYRVARCEPGENKRYRIRCLKCILNTALLAFIVYPIPSFVKTQLKCRCASRNECDIAPFLSYGAKVLQFVRDVKH